MPEMTLNMFSVRLKSLTDFERVLQSNGNGAGLFFHTGHELTVGQPVIIKASIVNNPTPIFLDGWVAWRRLRPRGSSLPRGLFVALSDGEQSRLEGFINFMKQNTQISIVRAYPRLPVFIPAHYLTNQGSHPALTRNLSMGGAFLKCFGPLLSVGARTDVMLSLKGQKPEHINLKSEVVRFVPLPGNQAIAVRFTPGQSGLSRLERAIKVFQIDISRRIIPYTSVSQQA